MLVGGELLAVNFIPVIGPHWALPWHYFFSTAPFASSRIERCGIYALKTVFNAPSTLDFGTRQ
jgi:hypothetical protein